MYRHASRPRKDWRKRVESQGLVFPYTSRPDGSSVPYWNESAFYELSGDEVDVLEQVTEQLHGMCLEAARFLATGEMGDLGLAPGALELVRHSLAADSPSIYGRFDLRYDGLEPAKLLEYNADTPTGLLEAAVAQWYWLQDVLPSADQWNSLHERLVEGWRALRPRLRTPVLHFAHMGAEETGEEWMTTAYLRDTAGQAGLTTVGLTLEDIGYDRATQRFVDLEERPLEACFKLYPWEDMLSEPFGRHVLAEPDATLWIEPPWKVVLSNKALLAALWHLFPGHENLLAAQLDTPDGLGEWVAKPLHGREGLGIRVHTAEGDPTELTAGGQAPGPAPEGYCFQQWAPLPSFDGNYAVLGAWVVAGAAAGVGVRESDGPITDRYARFVPHVIDAPRPDPDQVQVWLRS